MSLIRVENLNLLKIDGVKEHQILNNVNLSISQGESVVIMGKSGAGKSSLLHQLSALDRPSSGQVFIKEHDIHSLSENALSEFRLKTFGFVFQDYALIKDVTVIENVQLPLLMRGYSWNAAEDLAIASLHAVGLGDKARNLPAKLSGGEQQRVSIARAVAGKPDILFADEPTANLDSVSGKVIIDLFKEIHRQGQTIVMVTHEEEYSRWCQRKIILEDGQIISNNMREESSNLNYLSQKVRRQTKPQFFARKHF